MCSDPGQSLIREKIARRAAGRRRDRLLLTAHALEDLPQGGGSGRGSIRTWSRWPTSASTAPGFTTIATLATAKAIDLIRMSVAKVRQDRALEPIRIPVTRRALVIGGGVAGIQAALDIAEGGVRGGTGRARAFHRRQDGRAFRDLSHARLFTVHPHAADGRRGPASAHQAATAIPKSKSVQGYVGNFKVTVEKRPGTSISTNVRAAASAGTRASRRRTPASSTLAWATARPSMCRSRKRCPPGR